MRIRKIDEGADLMMNRSFAKFYDAYSDMMIFLKVLSTGKNIPDYVWGYPDYNPSKPESSGSTFNLYIPEDSTAAEALKVLKAGYGYRSHSDGWYEDNACLNYIPAITKDFCRDLDLFCKWRQRKYCFNGTYMWEAKTESTYTIYAFKKNDGSSGYYDEEGSQIWFDGNVIKEEDV